MFKNVLRSLEELKQVSIPIEADADGFIDRECPSEECLYQFKVHLDDWKNIVKDEVVYCPMCRKEAPSKSWFTKEQIEQGKQEALKKVYNALDEGFREDAREFNANQPRGGFISLRMKYENTNPPRIVMPIAALEEMEMKIKCVECNTRYAVLGSAFFCPSCGHNSAVETFDTSLGKIRTKIKAIDAIQEVMSKDESSIVSRHLLESSLLDGVVAFQRFCEVTFQLKCPGVNVGFNAFQRLDSGSNYWKNSFNEGYEDWLSASEMRRLVIYFQQRHILAHSEGFVDQKYIDKSNDPTYKVGQRIVIKENNVLDFLGLLEKLSGKVKALL